LLSLSGKGFPWLLCLLTTDSPLPNLSAALPLQLQITMACAAINPSGLAALQKALELSVAAMHFSCSQD